MPLPELCSRCRQLKQPDLGKRLAVPGAHRRSQFVCFGCLDKTGKLRRNRDRKPSPDEREVVATLAGTGMFFEQEKPLGPYWFDFCLPRLSLLIEVDSHTYHRWPRQLARDAAKDKLAQESGYSVVRVRRPDIAGKITAAIALRQQELLA